MKGKNARAINSNKGASEKRKTQTDLKCNLMTFLNLHAATYLDE